MLSLALYTLPAVVLALLVPLSPIIQTYLTSGLMWVAKEGVGLLNGRPLWMKRVALAVIGVLVSFGANLIGQAVGSDAMSWTAATAQGLAQALVSHLIYGFGKEAKA